MFVWSLNICHRKWLSNLNKLEELDGWCSSNNLPQHPALGLLLSSNIILLMLVKLKTPVKLDTADIALALLYFTCTVFVSASLCR